MKSKKIQRLMLGLILMVCVAELPLTAVAMSPSPVVKQALPQPSQPKKEKTTWDAILALFKRRKEPNLGSRSRGVCPVSPGLLEETNVIWSDRPLFLWQGISLPLEIRLYSPFDPKQEQEVIWRQNLNEISPGMTFQEIQYTGQALQPGTSYDWEIFNPSNKSKLRRSFQVMNVEERDRIAGELKSLEAQLRLEQATDEEIALERANYFAQRNLWSDALQEMYSVPNSSQELTQKVQELLRYLCNAPDAVERQN